MGRPSKTSPDLEFDVHPRLLELVAEYRCAHGLGDPRNDKDPLTVKFNGIVTDYLHESLTRFYWKIWYKFISNYVASKTGQSRKHGPSLAYICNVAKTTVLRWTNEFAQPTFRVRKEGEEWRPPGRRFEPELRNFLVPFGLLGIDVKEVGFPDGWHATWYAIVETTIRIRNELLGEHPDYPLAKSQSFYYLSGPDAAWLQYLVRSRDWVTFGESDPAAQGRIIEGAQLHFPRNPIPKREDVSRLLALWVIPYGLLFSVSDSLGAYIKGFSIA
jgi:hypothetical protein